jgi:hypothetical protein
MALVTSSQLAGNPELSNDGISLPSFMAAGNTFSFLPDAMDGHKRSVYKPDLLCPNVFMRDSANLDLDGNRNSKMTLDPTFYNYSLCICKTGYFWNHTRSYCDTIPVLFPDFKSHSFLQEPVFIRTGEVGNQQYQISEGVYPLELAVAALDRSNQT